MKPEVRPATLDDLRAFYGREPRATCQAFAGVVGDEVVAVGGVSRENGLLVAFLDAKPVARERYKLTLHKTALRVLERVARKGMPMVAEPDPEIVRAGPWLERLGFAPVGDGRIWVR